MQAIAFGGRNSFYGGAFGEGLVTLGDGLFTDADLVASQATWVDPLRAAAFGVELFTMPPNSQGYLLLGSPRSPTPSGFPTIPTTTRGRTS